MVRFALNGHDNSKKAMAIVREWAKANKGVVDASAITVDRPLRRPGSRPYNEKLSLPRQGCRRGPCQGRHQG